MHIYIYIYTHNYTYKQRSVTRFCANPPRPMETSAKLQNIREMGGAPRNPMNPAPRNHFLVWIV